MHKVESFQKDNQKAGISERKSLTNNIIMILRIHLQFPCTYKGASGEIALFLYVHKFILLAEDENIGKV